MKFFSHLVLSAFLLSSGASAQGEERPIEIVVKGSLRRLQTHEFPSSVTVHSGAEIRDRVVAPEQLSAITPNLNYSGGSNTPRFFQIRGIGEFEQYEGIPNSSVGIIIDDIDFTGLGIPIPFFDIGSVEVLRGPQVTAFGASALAGVININSNEPSKRLMGEVQLSAGNDYLSEAGVAISSESLPQYDLRFRSAYTGYFRDGFRENEFQNRDNTNERNEVTSRAKIFIAPSFESRLSLSAINIENKNGYDVFTVDNGFTVRSDRPGRDELIASGVALKGNVDLSKDLNLEFLTNLLNSKQLYSYDGDWGNNDFWQPYVPYDYFSETHRDRDNFSGQLRLGSRDSDSKQSLSWVTGIYGQKFKESSSIEDRFEQLPYRAIDSDYDAETWALFGEVGIPILTETKLVVGGRLEERMMDYRDSNSASLDPEDTMWGGSLSLVHDLSPAIMVYGTVSRGFKGGGVNPGTLVPIEQRTYGPESLINNEIGIKGDFWDGRLFVDTSLFFMVRDDAQLKFAFQNDPSDPLSFTYITQSAASGESYGVETRVNAKLLDKLEFFGSGALLNTQYTDVPEANINLEGRQNSHAPSWQYSAGFKSQFAEKFFGIVEVQGKDSFYFDDSNDQRSDSYHLVNSVLGFELHEFTWSIWIKNIFDERYAVRGFFFGVEPPDYESKQYIQLGDPRTFGTTLSLRF